MIQGDLECYACGSFLKGVGAGAFFGTKTCLTGETLTTCRIVGFR